MTGEEWERSNELRGTDGSWVEGGEGVEQKTRGRGVMGISECGVGRRRAWRRFTAVAWWREGQGMGGAGQIDNVGIYGQVADDPRARDARMSKQEECGNVSSTCGKWSARGERRTNSWREPHELEAVWVLEREFEANHEQSACFVFVKFCAGEWMGSWRYEVPGPSTPGLQSGGQT